MARQSPSTRVSKTASASHGVAPDDPAPNRPPSGAATIASRLHRHWRLILAGAVAVAVLVVAVALTVFAPSTEDVAATPDADRLWNEKAEMIDRAEKSSVRPADVIRLEKALMRQRHEARADR